MTPKRSGAPSSILAFPIEPLETGHVRAGGKQYVAIAAGGGGKMRTASSDAYVAFALP